RTLPLILRSEFLAKPNRAAMHSTAVQLPKYKRPPAARIQRGPLLTLLTRPRCRSFVSNERETKNHKLEVGSGHGASSGANFHLLSFIFQLHAARLDHHERQHSDTAVRVLLRSSAVSLLRRLPRHLGRARPSAVHESLQFHQRQRRVGSSQ